ncbi:GNAT family N-acetyltransferase [Maritimibacter sp. UBA3975]|uniref:GNAT family N-acetyltransferase n=1 Tax=Maritimibacter sp. UBA3975 TaxID=1946833 RepID=UPI000C09DEA7|nr:GNAT family N-acetyltransferase [Maritimibacter sp. UBA3975]MAM62767.1 GNAT family N-acetyltransferase [Maritimibacter sp.]|tara:strand:- start:3845 stop:4450 length:606 start_codon:yes stop_codon:yes gene_type:complete
MTAPTYPWETATRGPAADFAARLRDMLPQIDTARLTLRAPELGDFATYAEIMCSPRAEHMDGPMSREDAYLDFTCTVAGWLLRGHGLWTITARQGGDVLGFVLVNMEPGDQEPELGFFLTEATEGQGIAAEAATAARDHALGALDLPRLVSYVAHDNARSARLLDRLGAFRDAVAEEAVSHDCRVYRHAPAGGDGGMEAYA